MKNIYQTLGISPNSNLIEILESYKKKCLENPLKTFLYTKCLSILINDFKRLAYNANLYQISITALFQINEIQKEEIDEYELIPYIEWLSDFQNFFYDTKYQTNNQMYANMIEDWYDKVEKIIEELKTHIHSFYLN